MNNEGQIANKQAKASGTCLNRWSDVSALPKTSATQSFSYSRMANAGKIHTSQIKATVAYLNQWSNVSALLNTSGRRKLRRAHSSCRLF